MENEFTKLSEADREKYSSLHNSYPELGLVQGIYKTNCYGFGKRLPGKSGIFFAMSRLNHSCRPNCERWWNDERKIETLYALHDISTDEELTVYYTNIVLCRDERQARLDENWRFVCLCECCRLTGEQRILSDSRRERVKKTTESLESVVNERNIVKRALLKVKMAIKDMQDERLRGVVLASLCYDGYQISLLAKDLESAKKYIGMAHAEYLLGTGTDSFETKRMKGFKKKPKSHQNWR